MDELIRENFEPYITSVGGSGMGILSSFSEHRNQSPASVATNIHPQTVGQVTPPQTPAPEGQVQLGVEKDTAEQRRLSFNTTSTEKFAEWASEIGEWLYV